MSPEQLERAQELGAAATLRKPYTPKTLLEAVRATLEGSRQAPPDDLFRR